MGNNKKVNRVHSPTRVPFGLAAREQLALCVWNSSIDIVGRVVLMRDPTYMGALVWARSSEGFGFDICPKDFPLYMRFVQLLYIIIQMLAEKCVATLRVSCDEWISPG